ncbi:MAG TPA: DUF2279 domain-containing protein, partial [Kofleriaceae bacterium]|nr:DUF2279 domain-containing protein [Kofleriaceae bacterium]
MRKSVVVVLLIAWLQTPAVASPGALDSTPHDPDGADRAPARGTPWIDLAPSKVLAMHEPSPTKRDHKVASALTLAGLYAAFSTWTYFAWYRKGCRKPPRACTEFLWGLDGAFGAETYAGGADKLGHAWSTMGLARLGTEMLYQWGGYSRRGSIIVGAAMADALFLAVEVRDGFTYEMSYWDFTFDTIGAALAVALSAWPRLDELI